jgi:hypothetical protein
MTFIVDGTNGLTFPNSTTQASGGKVIQVVNMTSTTTESTTSTSYVISSLTASITPLFSNSKIFIIANCQGMVSASAVQFFYTFYRNSTDLGNTTGSVGMGTFYTASGGLTQFPLCFTYLDSPATTSATTYSLYYRVNTGTGTISNNTCKGSFTLIEVAA